MLGCSLPLWEPLGQAGLQGQSPSPPAWEAPQWGQHFLLSGWTLEALAMFPSWEAGIVSKSSPACLAAAVCLWREAGGLNSAFSSSLFHIWTGTTARDTFLFLQDQNRGGKNGKNVVCLPLSPPQRQHPGGSHLRGPALLLGIAEILWQECSK